MSRDDYGNDDVTWDRHGRPHCNRCGRLLTVVGELGAGGVVDTDPTTHNCPKETGS